MADGRAELVKELAGAVSAQSQVANQYWLALVTVSLVATLPRPQKATVDVFSLGPIDEGSFYLAMFGLLVVIMIAFASAHAQQVRAQRLALQTVIRLGNEPVFGVQPRDLFDMLRLPSVVRLAPLAQLFKGVDSFLGSPGDVPDWRKKASWRYYLVLKIASWIVYFGFPGFALWMTLWRTQTTGWLLFLLLVPALIATVSLLHVFVVDVWYAGQVKRILLEPNAPVASAAGVPTD